MACKGIKRSTFELNWDWRILSLSREIPGPEIPLFGKSRKIWYCRILFLFVQKSKTNSREPSGHPAGFFLQTSPFLCTSILPHQNWTCADSPSIFPKNLPTSLSACWHCNWPLQIFRLRSLEIEKTRSESSAPCHSNFRMLSRCPSRRKNWVDGKGLNTWLLQTSHCDLKNDDNFNVCKWCSFTKVSVFWAARSLQQGKNQDENQPNLTLGKQRLLPTRLIDPHCGLV